MRAHLVATVAAAALGCPLGAPPASAAPGVAVLSCNIAYFGASGTGDCRVTGGTLTGVVHIDFSSFPGCPLAQASGQISGAINGTFVWERSGPAGFIETSGSLNGGGPIAFSLPCQPVNGNETAVAVITGT
jgi:hypothetical protein